MNTLKNTIVLLQLTTRAGLLVKWLSRWPVTPLLRVRAPYRPPGKYMYNFLQHLFNQKLRNDTGDFTTLEWIVIIGIIIYITTEVL